MSRYGLTCGRCKNGAVGNRMRCEGCNRLICRQCAARLRATRPAHAALCVDCSEQASALEGPMSDTRDDILRDRAEGRCLSDDPACYRNRRGYAPTLTLCAACQERADEEYAATYGDDELEIAEAADADSGDELRESGR